MIISPCVANIASSGYVDEMRNNVQAKIDKKANNANYAQNMVLQTDGSGNVVATTVGTDLFADGAIETMHLTDGAVTNADLAGMIDITKLNLGTLPTRGKHMMIWNATTNEYVFEKYAEGIVLPAGYTQLEYIESTGTQYIDTGIKGNNNTRFDINFQNTAGTGMVFGSRISASSDAFAVWTFNSSITTSLRFGFDGTGGYTGNAPLTDRVFLSFDGEQLYRDGVAAWMIPSSTQFITPSNLLLFAYYDKNQIVQAQVKVFMLRLYDNTTLVRNFIPARNSDNVIGMYDTVTKTFFTNSGTGSFIAGPEIE